MDIQRHTENLPQGTIRKGAGLNWTLGTNQFGEVWEAGGTAWKIQYNKAYCRTIFSVATVGCDSWEQAASYAVKRAVGEYRQAKDVVARYEAALAKAGA
jgi:hypothetical protein